MKITRDMKIKDVLAVDEDTMLTTLFWLSPSFERLRHTKLRRAMGGRISVEQAARVARVPLTEMLYVLNLAAGEPEEKLSEELRTSSWSDFDYHPTNPPIKPAQLRTLGDEDPNVIFLDLMPLADARRDPMPAIAKELVGLQKADDVLLLRHPFDPIPLRDMLARRGLSSWAEERRPSQWFIYFYKPSARAEATAAPPVSHEVFSRAACAAA